MSSLPTLESSAGQDGDDEQAGNAAAAVAGSTATGGAPSPVQEEKDVFSSFTVVKKKPPVLDDAEVGSSFTPVKKKSPPSPSVPPAQGGGGESTKGGHQLQPLGASPGQHTSPPIALKPLAPLAPLRPLTTTPNALPIGSGFTRGGDGVENECEGEEETGVVVDSLQVAAVPTVVHDEELDSEAREKAAGKEAWGSLGAYLVGKELKQTFMEMDPFHVGLVDKVDFLSWAKKALKIEDHEKAEALWVYVARAAEGTAVTPTHSQLAAAAASGEGPDLRSTSPGSWIESSQDHTALAGTVLTKDSFMLAMTRRMLENPAEDAGEILKAH